MFDILKMHLQNNGYDNHIYYCLEEYNLEELKELLKKDYGYLDIVIDFEDISKLEPILRSIKDDPNQLYLQSHLYDLYLGYKILSQVKLEESKYLKTPNELASAIFGNDLSLLTSTFYHFSFIERKLDELAKSLNTRARIHILLDGITNNILQQKVNDFFYARSPICFMGYTSKDSLLHYYSSNGGLLEDPHDYSSFYPKDYQYRSRKK